MHMDVDNEYGVYGSGVTDLANACPEFDVIVAAHGHKSIPNKMINGVLVVENKNAGATVSDIHVYLERGLNGKWKVKDRTSGEPDHQGLRSRPRADCSAGRVRPAR